MGGYNRGKKAILFFNQTSMSLFHPMGNITTSENITYTTNWVFVHVFCHNVFNIYSFTINHKIWAGSKRLIKSTKNSSTSYYIKIIKMERTSKMTS